MITVSEPCWSAPDETHPKAITQWAQKWRGNPVRSTHSRPWQKWLKIAGKPTWGDRVGKDTKSTEIHGQRSRGKGLPEPQATFSTSPAAERG